MRHQRISTSSPSEACLTKATDGDGDAFLLGGVAATAAWAKSYSSLARDVCVQRRVAEHGLDRACDCETQNGAEQGGAERDADSEVERP